MNSFICPFCNREVFIDDSTRKTGCVSFLKYEKAEYITVSFYYCPLCGQTHVKASANSEIFGNFEIPLFPRSYAKQFPNYVPKAIREDYEEAYAIVHLSPKASATLSRRCLQSMIHDFWDIHEKNLNAEITTLKSKISPQLWQAIDSLRKIGNIGAHMEHEINSIVDISDNEAELLLKLVELLIQNWYVQRKEQETLLGEITTLSDSLQEKRNNS